MGTKRETHRRGPPQMEVRVVVGKGVSHDFSEEVMCELRLTGAWGCVGEWELSFTAERGCL